MSYVDQLLAQNEDIKYETHQHPFVFFSRILAELAVMAVLVVALIAVSQQQNEKWERVQPYVLPVLGILALIVLGSAVIDFLRWRNERYILTDRRVIHLRGIVNKSTMDSSLEKINDVQMRQTFFGRMFNYGDLEIQTANENSDNYLSNIRAPLEFKRAMLNAKEEHDTIPAAYVNMQPSANAYQPPRTPTGQLSPRLTQKEIEEQLTRLSDLRQKNLISDADFETKKHEILSRI